jgi:beta-N-acetylhexosaminidase
MSRAIVTKPDTSVEVLRRQAHRVLMAAFHGTEVPDWMHDALRDGLGSICLFGPNLTGDDAQAADLIHQLHAAAPDGCLITLDEEGGDVTRLDALRGSPAAGHAVLGAADDVVLTRQVAGGIGRRLHAIGVDLNLGPVADVNCEPDNPVIGVRSFGADPELVARHVSAFVDGLQTAAVAACLKHFPGHGATVEDSHLAAPRLDVDLVTLHERELVPFAAAVKAGVAAVMTSHVVVTALDPELPATTSPAILRVLRDDLGFQGVIIADALDMAGVALRYGGSAAAAVASLAAGVDLLCLGPERSPGDFATEITDVVDAVVLAVQEGRLPATRLAQACARVEQLIAAVETGTLSEFPANDGAALRRASAGEEPSELDGTGPGEDPSQVAARRALRVRRAPEHPQVGVDLAGAVVLEFGVTPGIAAGVVPWGLAAPLSVHLPGVERFPARAHNDVRDYLTAAANRPVLALVRDAHRHPWVQTQLTELAIARPDLITVETGWPIVDNDGNPTGLPGALAIWTYGGSAVSLRAAAQLLAGSDQATLDQSPRPDQNTEQGGNR